MDTDSTQRAPDFDRIAGLYRWMELFSFGPMLERCRFRYLQQASQLRNVLVLGDGDGRYSQRLLQRNQCVHLTAVDASGAMLAALLRRAAASGAVDRVTPVQQDLCRFTPGGRFDGVATHFSLDCLTEPAIDRLLAQIVPALEPGSVWIVSEFAVPPGRLRGAAARAVIGFLYLAFRGLTGLRTHRLPDYAAIFARYGLRKIQASQWLGGLLTAEVWSLAPRGDLTAPDEEIV